MKQTVVTIFVILMALITAVAVHGLYFVGVSGPVVGGIGFGMIIATGIVAVIGGDIIDEEEAETNKEERS